MFTPELVGMEYAGVHQVVMDSINRADLDLRKSLFSNIVLSGGGTLVKGQSSGRYRLGTVLCRMWTGQATHLFCV